jgi:hypothetical protein
MKEYLVWQQTFNHPAVRGHVRVEAGCCNEILALAIWALHL